MTEPPHAPTPPQTIQIASDETYKSRNQVYAILRKLAMGADWTEFHAALHQHEQAIASYIGQPLKQAYDDLSLLATGRMGAIEMLEEELAEAQRTEGALRELLAALAEAVHTHAIPEDSRPWPLWDEVTAALSMTAGERRA